MVKLVHVSNAHCANPSCDPSSQVTDTNLAYLVLGTFAVVFAAFSLLVREKVLLSFIDRLPGINAHTSSIWVKWY